MGFRMPVSQTLSEKSSNQLTASESTVDTIPLHNLCESCSNFFQQWNILDWMQQQNSTPVTTWPMAQLCKIAHLVEYNTSCHLCKFLLASLQRSTYFGKNRDLNLNIYLHPQEIEGDEDQRVNVRVAETPLEDTWNTFLVTCVLKKFKHSDVGGFYQYIKAKSVPLLAQDNLEQAKSWMEDCLSKHEKCHKFHDNTVLQNDRRPTRVLEVTANSLRLRCNMTNEQFNYFALSHMWGKETDVHLELSVSNIEEFQKDIPWHRLSSIYKEAIRVTLALGHQYLWIDSLCIIQDSVADWKHEASLMATVYGNATCNLTFLFPSTNPDTSTRDDPRDWNPCVLRPATSTQDGIYFEHQTGLLRTTYQNTEPQDWLIQRKWPLFSRAWTFQEYLLSPRTLLLGHRNLMWQCNAGFYDELLGPIAEATREANDTTPKRGRDMGKSRYFPKNLKPGFGEDVLMSSPKSLNFMRDWQALIGEYRSRNLTMGKDRIIAFAGVACAFQNLGSLTYLAGAWSEFLPLCLLWYMGRKSEAAIRRAGPKVIRGGRIDYPVAVQEKVVQEAPSWSQFSVPIYTHHQTFFLLNDDEVFVRCKSYGTTPRVYWDDIYWPTSHSFQFGGHPVGHFPEPNGFFDFPNLSITLNMPILPVKVSWPADLEVQFNRIRAANALDADLGWIPDFTYFPDNPSKSASPPKHGVLALISEFQTCRTAGESNVQRRFAGLVLVRGEREGTWIRVGAWKLRIKIRGVDVHDENIKDVAGRWKEYKMCVLGEAWILERVTLI